MPLLAPARPHRAGLSVCRQNRWSTSTTPVNTTQSVTSHTHKKNPTQFSEQKHGFFLHLPSLLCKQIQFPIHIQTIYQQSTISELEPLWSFMAFSCTFPMAASAHSAREMRRTPVCQKHINIKNMDNWTQIMYFSWSCTGRRLGLTAEIYAYEKTHMPFSKDKLTMMI